MITLHHLRIGRSIFTVWLLEEVGAEYELKVYHRDPATMRAPASLREAHPLGKSPVIEDGDLVLSESGAITEYILNKFDPEYTLHPRPTEAVERARYVQWLAYAEGSVFAPLLIKMLLLRSGEDHSVMRPFADAEIALHLGHISSQLEGQEFILGDALSGADFGCCYMVSMAARLGQLESYPVLEEYLARVQNRDAFKRAVERAVE
jgi:glutathione S-transferase